MRPPPDDDEARRLIEADALMARGDPRGELIAVQCELARLGDPPSRASTEWFAPPLETAPALRAREAALLRKHRRAWTEPARRHAVSDRHVWLYRGHVDRVGWDAYTRFPDGLAALVADVPTLKALDFASAPKSAAFEAIEAFVESEALAHLEEIDAGPLGPVAFFALLASPRLTRLDRILWSPPKGPLDWVARLADSPWTRRARGLVLRAPSSVAGALEALEEAAMELRELQLERCPIGAEGRAALASLDRLEVVGLTRMAGLAAPSEILACLPAARAIDLTGDALDHRALAAAPSRALDAVETWVLSKNPLRGLGLLARAELPRIRRLALVRCGLGDADVGALADAAYFSRLEELDLRENDLTPRAREALLARASPSIRLLV